MSKKRIVELVCAGKMKQINDQWLAFANTENSEGVWTFNLVNGFQRLDHQGPFGLQDHHGYGGLAVVPPDNVRCQKDN